MYLDSRSFDPYRVLNDAERAEFIESYRQFLLERDGRADAAARKLERRELRMREMEDAPVAWDGALDENAFTRCLAGEQGIAIDARTEWAVAAAKANEGESYGVEIELSRYARDGMLPGLTAPDVLLSIYMQESYHCRILVELCRACGLRFTPSVPAWTNRALVGLIGRLPPVLRWIPVMAGETVGAAVFRILYERVDLFDGHPEVQQRMRRLLREIWLDEVLHVAFLRTQIGALGLLAVRALVPIVASSVFAGLQPLAQIGVTPREIRAALERGLRMPDEVDWLEAPGASASLEAVTG